VLCARRALSGFVIALVLNGCAASQPQLWPPAVGERSYPIYVSLDTWHGMIGFHPDLSPGSETLKLGQKDFEPSSDRRPNRFEEWGYAERKWYVEGEQGIIGALRALLWPTEGTVEIGRHDQLWAYRTPQPPADIFVFNLTEQGLLSLHRHLISTLDKTKPIAKVGSSLFYPSRRAYHLFYNCHHYVAEALREAGLPVSPLWAITRATLAMQLRRVQRLAEQPARLRLGEAKG
jgi:Protein of unknown function (DUF2459)